MPAGVVSLQAIWPVIVFGQSMSQAQLSSQIVVVSQKQPPAGMTVMLPGGRRSPHKPKPLQTSPPQSALDEQAAQQVPNV